MKDLVIIGAGGFGREIKELVDEINQVSKEWNFLGFVDDNPNLDTTIEGDRVLGGLDYLFTMNPKPFAVIPIAGLNARRRIAKECEKHGIAFATLIHPSFSTRGNMYSIGEGTIICEKCGIAINSHIGKHCILNTGSGLGHDTTIGDFVDLMPYTQIMGDVKIGDNCYFGVRATVINSLSIISNTTIGACGCVVKTIDNPGTYVGVPAKMIKAYLPEEM